MPKLTLSREEGVKLPYAQFVVKVRKIFTLAERVTKLPFKGVHIALVGDVTIKTLNRIYRRHNYVTDVLSFTYESQPIVGELIICVAQAERAARRHKHSLMHELMLLTTHGMLHLAGHDHMRLAERKRMRALEQHILTKL